MSKPSSTEQVINPTHYDIIDGVTAIKLIASSLTEPEFYGYCMGNYIKYRSRLGKKHKDLNIDLDKSNNHIRIFNQYKHLCRGTSLRHA